MWNGLSWLGQGPLFGIFKHYSLLRYIIAGNIVGFYSK